jgi:hypothetical protein
MHVDRLTQCVTVDGIDHTGRRVATAPLHQVDAVGITHWGPSGYRVDDRFMRVPMVRGG